MRTVRLDTLQPFQAVNLLSDPGEIGGPVVIPQCAQIGLVWTLTDGHVAHNVMYGRYSGAYAGTQTQANAILSALIAGGTWTALAAYMSNTGSLTAVTLRNVAVPNQAVVQSNNAGSAGSSASIALPDETALVVTLRTAQAGPGFRGRVYIPNWATNALGAGNVVLAAAVTALGAWATANLLTAPAGQGYTPVIGQRERAAYTGSTGTVHAARPAGSVTITSAVVRDNHWDTQRKRGLK
jgi:hypothetical protein